MYYYFLLLKNKLYYLLNFFSSLDLSYELFLFIGVYWANTYLKSIKYCYNAPFNVSSDCRLSKPIISSIVLRISLNEISHYHRHEFIRSFSTSFYPLYLPTYDNFNDDEINISLGSYGWKNFISKEYNVITPYYLEYELKRFCAYFDSKHKDMYFAIIFKIKFPNGHFRSCSYVQVSNTKEFDKLYSVFAYIFTLEDFSDKVSEEHNKEELFVDNLPKGNIFLSFKVISDIKKTKYDNFITAPDRYLEDKGIERKDFPKDFKYKDFSIPAHMDLWLWPNITFSGDYTSAHSTYKAKLNDNKVYLLDFLFTINSTSYTVYVRNLDKVLFSFKDESLNFNKDLSHFKRTIVDNKVESFYVFDEYKIVFFSKLKKTSYISKIPKDFINLNKPKILTLDLETRVDKDNCMRPLVMSIYDGKSSYSTKFSYAWQSDMVTGLQHIMKRKYDGYRIYIHNFSYFDAIFMIDVLSTLGEVKPIKRDNQFIKITFIFKNEKGNNYVLYFYDSMLLFHDSLDNLSKSFNIESKKRKFPLLFLNRNDFDFDYIGDVPPYKYFPKAFTEDFTKEYYEKYCLAYKQGNWNLSKELIHYCEVDTIALYQIIIKFKSEIYKTFGKDITKYPTLPSLAFAIYRSNFLYSNKLIPNILSKLHFTLKQSYLGGITETYKGFGLNINSYDINSLYPYSMKSFAMPTGEVKYFKGDLKYVNNPFGFFKVKVSAPDSLNKPFLPTKILTKNGIRTIFPVGTWSGWYFSEEIINARKFGYRFKIIEGYLFEKNHIFSKYIEVLYKMKKESDPSDPRYYIAKLLMNSLYGRFGLNPVEEELLVLSEAQADKIIEEKNNVNVIPLLSGNVIVSYNKNSSDGINIDNISVPISSAIAAYSRITMSQYMVKYSPNLYAIDTDGIKISCELSASEVDNKRLGKFKYEFTFKEAVFPAPKVYGGLLVKPYKKYTSEIVKIKGLKNPIHYFIFKSLQNKNTNLIIQQEKWIRDISSSTIIVSNDPYTLAITENKREIIYDNFGNFIDSIPLYLENGKVVSRKPPLLYYLPGKL